ncbi:hypothetical protein PCG10_007131 [Penicillium crustosum]|uniref:HNH nuclease domain-containing protein n=1 Tax=Penicillium crustosum TaxID=36656 RepID=A0A9P5GWG7_PENCR|nr:hypothetical protein PCG10_007131 [Penicillium crustosum]
MGLAIKGTGAGQRDTNQQSSFRADMIQAYEAKHPTKEWVWCPILGDYTDDDDIQASHLFPYMNGQDTMDAIFGKTRPGELFSPRNGLLMCRKLERYFDAGKFVIVPDVPNVQENVLVSTVKSWLSREPREYRVRIIDPDWEMNEQQISRWGELTYGQLEGRKLRFRSSFRPAARYLYFHYCVQMLPAKESQAKRPQFSGPRREGHFGGPRGDISRVICFWRWLRRWGHEYSFVLDGAAGSRPDDNNLLLGLLSKNVKAKPSILDHGVFGDVRSEDEVSGIEEDSDEE